jgi:hypothetical protein
MSSTRKPISSATNRPPFYVVRSSDGCDECFDVWSRVTNRCIASFPFWDVESEAMRAARRLTRTLNHVWGHCSMQISADEFDLSREEGDLP